MAEFVGGEPISVGVDEPVTFENKTDTAFDVGYGIVFRKSGLYRVSIVGRHISVAVEPERQKGKWVDDGDPLTLICDKCGYRVARYNNTDFCPNCGNDKRGEHVN